MNGERGTGNGEPAFEVDPEQARGCFYWMAGLGLMFAGIGFGALYLVAAVERAF